MYTFNITINQILEVVICVFRLIFRGYLQKYKTDLFVNVISFYMTNYFKTLLVRNEI